MRVTTALRRLVTHSDRVAHRDVLDAAGDLVVVELAPAVPEHAHHVRAPACPRPGASPRRPTGRRRPRRTAGPEPGSVGVADRLARLWVEPEQALAALVGDPDRVEPGRDARVAVEQSGQRRLLPAGPLADPRHLRRGRADHPHHPVGDREAGRARRLRGAGHGAGRLLRCARARRGAAAAVAARREDHRHDHARQHEPRQRGEQPARPAAELRARRLGGRLARSASSAAGTWRVPAVIVGSSPAPSGAAAPTATLRS